MNNLPKVIVAGSRTFNDYDLLKDNLDALAAEIGQFVLISGGAPGADTLGERWADEHNFTGQLIPAEWDKFGKSAGPIRNKKMADIADRLVLFWDGKSRGSKNMLQHARDKGIPYKIIRYKD